MVATLPGSQSLGFTSEGAATVEAPSTRERRSPGTKRRSRRKARRSRREARPMGPLGSSTSTRVSATRTVPSTMSWISYLGKRGLSVEAEAHLDAAFTRGGNLSMEGERGNPIGISDHVVGDLGGPLREGVVGDGVGERVEEALVEGSPGGLRAGRGRRGPMSLGRRSTTSGASGRRARGRGPRSDRGPRRGRRRSRGPSGRAESDIGYR